MSILIKPIITEKATADSEMNNRYTFMVDTTANKVEIKKAVEAAYGVHFFQVLCFRPCLKHVGDKIGIDGGNIVFDHHIFP